MAAHEAMTGQTPADDAEASAAPRREMAEAGDAGLPVAPSGGPVRRGRSGAPGGNPYAGSRSARLSALLGRASCPASSPRVRDMTRRLVAAALAQAESFPGQSSELAEAHRSLWHQIEHAQSEYAELGRLLSDVGDRLSVLETEIERLLSAEAAIREARRAEIEDLLPVIVEETRPGN